MRITAVLGIALAVGGAGYWLWSKRKPVVPARQPYAPPLMNPPPLVTYQLPPGQTIPGPLQPGFQITPIQSTNPLMPGYQSPQVGVNPFLVPTPAAATPVQVLFVWRPGTPPVRQAQIQQQFGLTPTASSFGNLLAFNAVAPQGVDPLFRSLQAVPELQQMSVMEAAPA